MVILTCTMRRTWAPQFHIMKDSFYLGKPSDSIFDGARELRTIANVLAIAVGKDVGEEDLLTIGSSPKFVRRVENYSQLSSIKTVLYRSVCGENCVIDK